MNDYSLFPNPIALTYNNLAYTGATFTPNDFVNQSFSDFSNLEYFKLKGIDTAFTNFDSTILAFDELISTNVFKGIDDIHYGNYFIYTLNSTHIEVVIFCNASANLGLPVFGNYML